MAGLAARACAEGAYYNVLINLGGLDGDGEWRDEVARRAEKLVAATRATAKDLARSIEEKLKS